MTWLTYQTKLRGVLLAADPSNADFLGLGAEPARWRAYRRMVRSRFAETIEHGFERLKGVVGADRFGALLGRFLAEAPPRSPYLRDIPGEFLRFIEKNWSVLSASLTLPVYALDLARYEWAELETAYAFEEVDPLEVAPLHMQRVAVLSPAHRLLELDFPVHRLGTEGDETSMNPGPVSLCLYRDAKTHEVTALELTPVTATMLTLMEQRSMALTDVVRNAADSRGLVVDVAFVDALSTLLADLIERGVLLGSLADESC
jgi:uncharacterized protein